MGGSFIQSLERSLGGAIYGDNAFVQVKGMVGVVIRCTSLAAALNPVHHVLTIRFQQSSSRTQTGGGALVRCSRRFFSNSFRPLAGGLSALVQPAKQSSRSFSKFFETLLLSFGHADQRSRRMLQGAVKE